MREFVGWAAGAEPAAASLPPDETVFLWDDLTVVHSPVAARPEVLWVHVTPQWRTFCAETLGFAVPEDIAPPHK
ncbi:hypothetical protein ACFVZ4_29335 [Streptomyces goshikiensis]|uniref:hypothetical protein n=1 Tax=Streptomyces goshikiensis TaxID=1942 RepID=UPI0036BA4415